MPIDKKILTVIIIFKRFFYNFTERNTQSLPNYTQFLPKNIQFLAKKIPNSFQIIPKSWQRIPNSCKENGQISPKIPN